MRVIVTGGTGFVGRALVRALAERGDEAVIVSRRPSADAVGWDALPREVDRADAVVHLAGEPVADARWTPARLAAMRESRVPTTAAVARAIEGAARRPRVLVSASAIGIYGMRQPGDPDSDRHLDEGVPPGEDVLARLVVDWEEAAAPARAAGVRVAHPRTGIVLGKGGGALEKMAAPFKWFVGGPIGGGGQWMSWVHLRDTVRALLFAIDEEAVSGPFNVVAPEPVTNEVFSEALGRALHRPARLHVPAAALKLALGRGLAGVLLTGQRVVPQKLLAAGFRFDFPNIDEALADLL